MPFDPYENFRLELDDEERGRLARAAEERDALRPDPNHTGCFLDRNGRSILDPVVQCHMDIAEQRARGQVPANLPEDELSCIIYPGIDPGGKYSSIDMGFAHRLANIQARAQYCSEDAKEAFETLYANLMLPPDGDMFNLIDDEQSGYRYPLYLAMREACKEHQICSRAVKLTPDNTARQLLKIRQRNLEVDPRVVQFDLMLQGLEYLVGIRPGPAADDVMDFYQEIAKSQHLRPELVARASDRASPEHVRVNFQDPGQRAIQIARANPHNWTRPLSEIEESIKIRSNLEKFDGLVTPYAAATAKRMIDPAFDDAERSRGDIFDRADLIIIGGRTVREIMEERFLSSGQKGSFLDFYKQYRLPMTNELVAAGLMAGERVEAFIPDHRGRLPDEPTQLIQDGYRPSPAQPEQFNAWQRFFSKRGFYREKAARQAEYERTMAARERVKRLVRLKDLPARSRHYSTVEQKDLFLRPVMNQLGLVNANGERDENGLLPPDWEQATAYMHRLGAQGAYGRIARSEAVDTCVLFMAIQGHSFQDIMDPEKLQAEREAAAQLFMEKARANDQEWLGRVFYHGQKELLRQARELAQSIDPQNEAQLLTVLPVLQSMATVCFSVTQQTREDLGSRVPYMMEGVLETANRDLAEGCKRANALETEINNLASFFKELELGLTVQSKLANAATSPEELELTNHEVTSLAVQQILSGGIAAGQSLMDQIPDARYTVNLRGDIQYESIESIRHYLNRPKNWDYARHLAATGEIDNVLTFTDRTSPALNGRGEPLMEQNTMYTLTNNTEGKLVSAPVRVPTGRQATGHDIQLGLSLPQERYEANLADLRQDEIARRVERLNTLAARSQSSADRNRELFFAPIMEEKGLINTQPDGTRTYDWDGLQREMAGHGAKGAYLGATRTELTSACICFMATQGYSFKEIMDPNQLREQRLAAARLLLAKGEANDQEFLGKVFYHGQKAMIQQFDQLTRGLDLQDEDRMMRVLPDMQAITGACFSVSQMLSAEGCRLSYIREAVTEARGNETQGVQRAHELDTLVGNLNNFSEQTVRAYQIQARMASSTAAPDAELLTDRDMGFLFMYNVLADQVKGDGPLSRRVPVYREAVNMENDITRSPSAEQIRLYLNHPQNRDRAKELAGSGELTKALSVQCAAVRAKDRQGRELTQGDTVYTLKPDEQTGRTTVERRVEQVPLIDYGFRFRLNLPGLTQQELQEQAAEQRELQEQAILQEAARQQAAQRESPQQQVQKAAQPKAPHKQPPQKGMAL